jgi:PAS domain S-box-containing protein
MSSPSDQNAEPFPESDLRLREIFEHSRDAIGIASQGVIRLVNPAYAALLGYSSPNEMKGLAVWETVAPSDRPGMMERAEHRTSGAPEASVYQFRGLKKDGTECDLENYVSSYTLEDRVYTVVTTRDITERKQQEEALRESEERFRLALSAAQVGTWEIDLTAMTGNFSEQVGPMLGQPRGYRPKTLEQWGEQIHPDDLEKNRHRFMDAVEGRSNYDVEYRVIWPDGVTVRALAVRGEILRDPDGRPLRAVGVVQDITERKRAEEARLQSEILYRTLAESVPHMVWILRADGSVEYCNRRMYDYMGMSSVEDAYTAWDRALPPEDRERIFSHWAQSLKSGESFEDENRLISVINGEARWHLVRAEAVRDEQGNIVRWFGTNTDIHEQKRREENQRFLAELGTRMRAYTTTDEILKEAVQAVGQYLNVSRCSYSEIDLENDSFTTLITYVDGSIKLQDTYRLSYFAASYLVALTQGETVTVNDAGTDPRTAPAFDLEYRKVQTRALIVVPLLKDGKWVASFSVSTAEGPRNWTREEIELVEQVAERTWFAVLNVRLEAERLAAARETAESLARLDTLLSASPVAFAVLDRNFRFLQVNEAFAAFNQISPKEHVGLSIGDTIPDQWGELRRIYQNVLDTGIPIFNREMSGANAAAPDEQRHWLSSYYPIRTPSGETLGLGLVIVEITERKRIEEEVKRLNEDLERRVAEIEALFHRIPVGIAVAERADGTIIKVNPTYAKWVNAPPGVNVSRTGPNRDTIPYKLVRDGVDLAPEDMPLQYVGRTGLDSGEYEVELVRGDGFRMPLLVYASPLFDEDGKVRGGLGTFVDLTEIKRAQERLRYQERLTEAIARNAVHAIFLLDGEGHITYINPAAEAMFGYSKEELLGKVLHDSLHGFHPDGTPYPMSECELSQVFITGRSVRGFEDLYIHKDGRFVPVACSNGPIIEDGRVVGAVIIAEDITERKRVEEELQMQAQVLASITEGVSVSDENGFIVYTNPAEDKLFGYEPGGLIGKHVTVQNTYPSEVNDRIVADIFTRLKREGVWSGEFSNRKKDGSAFPTHARITSLQVAGRQYWVCVQDDITEQLQTENERAQHLQEIESLNVRLQRAMSETHHRVKNNLQVIMALLNMETMEHAEAVPATNIKEIAQHVQALSVIHDILTGQARSDALVSDLSVRAALEKLLPTIQGMVEGRELNYTVEDARISIQQSSSLAMLVNELVSNAVKHGRGDIELRFAVTSGLARLEVTDQGPGFPNGFDPKVNANTGMELIESLAQWDLRGEVYYENRPTIDGGGACVLVEFPLTGSE